MLLFLCDYAILPSELCQFYANIIILCSIMLYYAHYANIISVCRQNIAPFLRREYGWCR